DGDDVLDRTPDHTLGAGISTTTHGHDAGQGLAVGSDALLRRLEFLVVDHQLLGTVLLGFLGINLKNLGDEVGGFFAGERCHGETPFVAPTSICARRQQLVEYWRYRFVAGATTLNN